MTRPWVVIITGFCTIITVAFAIRQLRGGNPGVLPGAPATEMELAAKAISERGDWDARAGASGPRLPGNQRTGLDGPRDAGKAGHGERVEGGTAKTVSGERRSGSSLGYSGSSGSESGDNPIGLSAVPGSAARHERGAGLFEDLDYQSSLGGVPKVKSSDEEEDNGDDDLVLSLPLDGSAEPETGESPIVTEGITFESNGGARFSTDAQFAIPSGGRLSGEAGTVAFTIEPEWFGSDQTDASLLQIRTPNQWEDRIQISKNGRYLRFLFTDHSGIESGAGYIIDNWQPGQTYDVRATWGDALASLYVNGRLVGQGTYSGQFIPPTGPIYIGSDFPGGQPGARAVLSNVKLYNRAAPPE